MRAGAIFLILSLPAAPQDRNAPDFPPTPGWLPDLPGGFAEAKRTGKPLMVVFR